MGKWLHKKRMLTVLILVGALSGCATYNTAQHIRPWGDEAWGMDQVDAVSTAYREANGDVRVCLKGDPAERAYTTAVLLGGVDYSVVLPVSLYEAGPDAAPALHRTADPVPRFRITGARVEGPCPEPHAGRVTIPLRKVEPNAFGVNSFVQAGEADVARLFAEGPAGHVVWEFASNPSSAIYYRHGGAIFDGSAVVEIQLALRRVKPRPVWALVMPFALAFDVATSPVQLAMCLFAHCPVG